jgi:hypothetical protein
MKGPGLARTDRLTMSPSNGGRPAYKNTGVAEATLEELVHRQPEHRLPQRMPEVFYADFVSYGRSGKPVTGAEYIKQEFGPTPKRLLPVRKQSGQRFHHTPGRQKASSRGSRGDELGIVGFRHRGVWRNG